MASSESLLTFDMSSFWQAGTGRGESYVIDAKAHRDHRGLPELPGRSVKGLVRDAVVHGQTLGVLPELNLQSTDPQGTPLTWPDYLFGPRGEDGADTWQGLLRFSSARLAAPQARALARDRELQNALFEVHHSTAVSTTSGTATHYSLRSMEVSIPLRLHSHVTTVAGVARVEHGPDWHEVVELSLPLVRSIGAKRSRGYGRCAVTLTRDSGSMAMSGGES